PGAPVPSTTVPPVIARSSAIAGQSAPGPSPPSRRDYWTRGAANGLESPAMDIDWRLFSCDDHLDMWNLPANLWEGRLPARLRERGPRVVEQGAANWWTCDG